MSPVSAGKASSKPPMKAEGQWLWLPLLPRTREGGFHASSAGKTAQSAATAVGPRTLQGLQDTLHDPLLDKLLYLVQCPASTPLAHV